MLNRIRVESNKHFDSKLYSTTYHSRLHFLGCGNRPPLRQGNDSIQTYSCLWVVVDHDLWNIQMLTRQLDPPLPYHGMPVSEADYWRDYYDGNQPTFEWNNGRLEEKGVSDWETAKLFFWFFQLLSAYLQTHPSADLVMLEMGFSVQLPGKKVIRRPDIGLVHRDNPIALKDRDRSYQGIYDLCLEGLSDSSKAIRENDTLVKPKEYAKAGVKEYFILYHKLDECMFYRLTRHGVYVPIQPGRGDVICSQVLPGFQWRLAELESQPALIELVDHPVYQDYVWTALSESRKQTELAKQHAAIEAKLRVQAEQHAKKEARLRMDAESRLANETRSRQDAEQQAQRYAERLRALGIDPERDRFLNGG